MIHISLNANFFIFLPGLFPTNNDSLVCPCSGQRVIVQQKDGEQVVENVVTIQVQWRLV